MNQIATLAGGCYWCFEALYQRVNGVSKVVSGYTGGTTEHPTVDQVYAGGTGHAEGVQVTFDPDVISYRELLEIFFTLHDPTTLNRQGHDVGEIYRSAIYFHDAEQQRVAHEMIDGFASELYDDPVVTQLEPYTEFWVAEEYMLDYFNRNPNAGYCMIVINPKVQKLRQQFAAKLKPAA